MTALIKLHFKLILQRKGFILLSILISFGLGYLPGYLSNNASASLNSKINEKTAEKWKAATQKAAKEALISIGETRPATLKNIEKGIYNSGIDNNLKTVTENSVGFFSNLTYPYIVNILSKSFSTTIDQATILLWCILSIPFLSPFLGTFVGLLEKQNHIETLIFTSGSGIIASLIAKVFTLVCFAMLTTLISIAGFYFGNGALSLPTIPLNEFLTISFSIIFLGSLFAGIFSLLIAKIFKETLNSYFLGVTIIPLTIWAILSINLGINSKDIIIHKLQDTAINSKIPKDEISNQKFPNMVEKQLYLNSQLFALSINEEMIPKWASSLKPNEATKPLQNKSIEVGIIFMLLSLLLSMLTLGLMNRK